MAKPVRKRVRTSAHLTSTSHGALNAGRINDPNNDLALEITYVDPAVLKPPKRKLRKHGQRQLAALRASISHFSFLNPILVDENNQILCGRARWLAAMDLGFEAVPVICIAHLSDEQKRLYVIAENRIGELGEWDVSELKLEFGELLDLGLPPDLNIGLSGFSTSEIDGLVIEPFGSEGSGDSPLPSHPPVTQEGDLWVLGEHRLLCGDALKVESYQALMGEERAQMVFSDAPYNLPMSTISGKGKAQFDDFAFAAGEMSQAQFISFLKTAFGHMAAFSVDGAIHFQCMDWKHQREMLDAGEAVYSELKNLIVWNKGSGGMGTFYRSQHELIYAWKVGKARHINNFGLGETGRYRTNCWTYRGNNSFHRGRDEELATHATVKPLQMVCDAILDCSHPRGIILDGFGGSGTTLHAAEKTGRKARLIEIDPTYCDRTIERWQAETGSEAVLAASGKSYCDIAAERGIELDPDEAMDGGEED
ncbi:site-specific DNA-methyltransferase [Altererythrobacter sp. GH1-8]|uniref:site-specific DNA-methyltransferase n=1 Tax=Altererythrobacter sp. GH1-8 TaxID=3349333 RepID=UPI00374CCDEB